MKKIIQYAIAVLTIVASNTVRSESIEQFNDQYYAQICKRVVACSEDHGIAENLQMMRIGGFESCVLSFTRNDSPQTWRQTITAKTAVFHPKNAQICLDSITELSCKQLSRRIAKPSQIEGCESVIMGTVDDAAQCSTHMECKSNDASCYGNCERPRLLQCGETSCSSNEYCDTEKNRCASFKKVGDACSNFSECDNKNCANNFCKALTPVVKHGGQCGNENDGHICSIGEYCAGTQCVPFRKKGESCSTDYKQFKQCEAPLECQESKCM